MFALASLAGLASAGTAEDHAARVAQLNADNPHATFSVEAIAPHHKGGCYRPRSAAALSAEAARAPFSFTADELRAAKGAVNIDWREHGAVGPIQQQHPFGTCWAFSMTAVTEAVSVIQGGNEFEKLSEQMTVSCVPATATGDNSDVLWSWALHNTGGRYQTDAVYPYNRTCNSYRETQLAPDGTPDGYSGTCDFKHPAPAGPCPPCGPDCRADGTPPCRLAETQSAGFSKASVQGWGFIAPHGRRLGATGDNADSPNDVSRMVAALVKYGPAQIGIDAGCVIGYTGGIITNCTRTVADQDHAVAIVGAGTDEASGVDYWLVRNSWDTTFGEDGYFRMQRDTMQMGIFGGYFACYNKDCTVDPGAAAADPKPNNPGTAAADPKPNWPTSFVANFTENFKQDGFTANSTGFYALDLGFDGGKGAQAIYRSDGTATSCGLFHPGAACTQLAVDEQRYLIFPDERECCTCCSWADGCGPIIPAWTANAQYAGTKDINGVTCDDFSIKGFETNHLLQTTDGGSKLCELDNAGSDHMYFDPVGYSSKVDPSVFVLPAWAGACSKSCGKKGECH